MITVENLRKRFNHLVAVDGISFQIREGEIFGLLGPNGAGKTTTINLIVGALKPDGGTVNIDGFHDPTKPELRNKIGCAPQTLAIYNSLTATENLSFFGRMYGLSGPHLKERVRWALVFAGLQQRSKEAVSKFSGGMARRLNLACALVHDPPILLLDEPTVGVDPQSRHAILESIDELNRQGRTIIYTTHYMEEAQRLCHRVAIIDHGNILALDTVENLTTEYGGKSIIKAEIDQLPSDTSSLPGSVDGNVLRIETTKPMEDLAKWTKTGLNFSRISVERPNLEQVFLNLTGRRLRD
jgi:ABC-2 type transport system ATP-binding protein